MRLSFLKKLKLQAFSLLFFSILVFTLSLIYFHTNLLRFTTLSSFQIASNVNILEAKSHDKHISKLVTVVFRQFEEFDNDIADSVRSFLKLFPNIQILIICNVLPYPPITFSASNVTLRNVRIISLNFNLLSDVRDLDPLNFIKTKNVLFVPDSVRISSRHIIQQMLAGLGKHPDSIIAVPFSNSRPQISCQTLDWNYREWTLKYERQDKGQGCSGVSGKHAILLSLDTLKPLPKPFTLPFPEALYIQTAARNKKVHLLLSHSFSEGRMLLHSQSDRQRFNRLVHHRRLEFYKKVGIKRVVTQDNNVQWYGCSRNTERCFPPVQGVAWYLAAGRWTPPCCLRHLRALAAYVSGRLQAVGARFWLEGAALVGAVRISDVLPWSDHIDFGVYSSDIPRIIWLNKASIKGNADENGYHWEKATQGEFYRVIFSRKNRIFVNILPFHQKNGTMKKDMWFLDNQKEFPEHYLHPMSSIEFAGVQMPCPNNVKEFLEVKYFKGIIEKTRIRGSNLPYP